MKSSIEVIRNKILNNDTFGHSDVFFAGADLIISPEPLETINEGKTVVVTQHAAALSGLIFELQTACSDWLDYLNKYDFFPFLGKAANQYLERDAGLKGLLLSVADAALKMEDEYNRILYFAYGSNMDEAQMARRCPDAKVVGVVTVPGYRFALDVAGVATILPDDNQSVTGLMWSVTPEDIENLDRYEGIANGCYRRETLMVDNYEPGQEALVYISNRRLTPHRVRDGYMERIIRAAVDHHFSRNYINMLESSFSETKGCDSE